MKLSVKLNDGEVKQTKAAIAIKAINEKASIDRNKYTSPIQDQGVVYMLKRDEAQAYVADPEPDINQYPFIKAEIGITGDDGWQVAQVFLGLNAIYIEALATIECQRHKELMEVPVDR